MQQDPFVIAMAGNPNVGKSTLFNEITGMKQHTGNWTGKTVSCAVGRYENLLIADIPGTYSLVCASADETAARDYLLFGGTQGVVVVCDACCLERNLNLLLQTMEVCDKVILCINLVDQANKKGIAVDVDRLASRLPCPIVTTCASKKQGISGLICAMQAMHRQEPHHFSIDYGEGLEQAIATLEPMLHEQPLPARYVALRLLDDDRALAEKLGIGEDILTLARQLAEKIGDVSDKIASDVNQTAHALCDGVVSHTNKADRSTQIDRIITSRRVGIPLMIALLCLILWVTISGANVPSDLLWQGLYQIGVWLRQGLEAIGCPAVLCDVLIDGIYKTTAWVTSVMLPPMAVFFPLFTLLEDLGYLPRIAFNLDHTFSKCGSCGKQALTMAMGFGCNAVGVTGCRIIDSRREKLIAILTNAFVPCNGRFPLLIAMIGMFFAVSGGLLGSLQSAVMLTGVILLGIGMTFLVSKILSLTLLKGEVSAFTLELPPYRKPQIGKVIVRSILDRILFVLGRAVSVAAPAGLLIWVLANVSLGGQTLLATVAEWLDPLGRLMGMDGVILLAFVLALPANEVVLPVMIMAYTAQSSLVELTDLTALHSLFVSNGWTATTALCVMLFSLMHWPCSTTLLTVKKETGSVWWTVLSAVIPTLCGMILCMLVALVV